MVQTLFKLAEEFNKVVSEMNKIPAPGFYTHRVQQGAHRLYLEMLALQYSPSCWYAQYFAKSINARLCAQITLPMRIILSTNYVHYERSYFYQNK